MYYSIYMRIFMLVFHVCLLFLCSIIAAVAGAQVLPSQWPTYGGDAGGTRFTDLREITPENLSRLVPAWTFHTGALGKGRPSPEHASFEVTPIIFNGLLYLSSPYDDVYALNPKSGAMVWSFDPKVTRNLSAGLLTSRGVAAWPQAGHVATSTKGACATRIFVATMEAQLIAVDAATGLPCKDFGQEGRVDLTHVVGYTEGAVYFNTSPPTVVNDLVIVGSLIGDNIKVNVASGVVRAFDVHTGALVWSWEPLPWAQSQQLRTGAGNTWSVIAADPANNLVFLPTGAASPDFYGGMRPGDNRDANSVVALEASTGRRVWGFQVVHHDLWDYDVAAEPLLFMFRGKIPAVAITTKQGLVFVLNRLTGEPLYPVEERPVPASDVPGEETWPTQPFQRIDSLTPLTIGSADRLGDSPQDDRECRDLLAGLRYDGMYTPPSLRGSALFPANLGGVNWGSAAFDPNSGILYANTNRYAFSVRLIPRHISWSRRLLERGEHGNQRLLFALADRRILRYGLFFVAVIALFLLLASMRRSFLPRSANAVCLLVLIAVIGLWADMYAKRSDVLKHRVGAKIQSAEHFGIEAGPQQGTPYAMLREPLVAPTSGNPCVAPPWGAVVALNLNTGKSVWQVPLGTVKAGEHTGTTNLGGDLVTAAGLLFTAASRQPLLRAFRSTTGEELWQADIGVPAQATPMSYSVDGHQYVVIAAGGHGMFGTATSDAVIAFALR